MAKLKDREVRTSLGHARRRQLLWVGVASLVAALVMLGLNVVDQSMRAPVHKRVAVYFVHGCPCVSGWVARLRDAGYAIEIFEPESLSPIRQSLRTPPGLHGCHVAQYLDYFLEGHIPPSDLRRLAKEKPVAIGLAANDQSLASNQEKEVQVVHADGHFEPWLQARSTP